MVMVDGFLNWLRSIPLLFAALGVFGSIRFIITLAIVIGVLLASVLAFFDAMRVPADAFPAGEKRTKKFWLLATGVGLLFAVMGAVGMIQIVMNILAIAPAAIYWYDVRPAVRGAGIRRAGNVSKFKNGNSTRKRNGGLANVSPLDSRAAGNPNDPRFDI